MISVSSTLGIGAKGVIRSHSFAARSTSNSIAFSTSLARNGYRSPKLSDIAANLAIQPGVGNRVLDRFEEPVVCIGILGDSSKTWRPDAWHVDVLGCQLSFVFPVVKLQDFTADLGKLEDSRNPFATVIASHLRAQASAGNPGVRFQFKVDLVRSLYGKQWHAEQVRRLFRFIDWVMDLPQPFELEFRDTLKDIEAENDMPYVTSVERLAKIEGKIQMLQELLRLPITA